MDHVTAPPGAAVPPLSLATRVGGLVFVSGTPGHDAERRLPEDFAAQFANAVANLRAILAQAGAGMGDIAKVNVLLTRPEDVAAMNPLYAEAFGPAPYPARTTAVVLALPDPRMLIEIECVAALPGG